MSAGQNPSASSATNNHPFWQTQPVKQFADADNLSFPEGPISPQSDPNQIPYNLPAQFEWSEIDIDDDSSLSHLQQFMAKNYVDNVAPLPFSYSPAFLRWLLGDLNCVKSLHVGVCVKETKKLVGFVAGAPATIRIRSEIVRVAVGNVLCVHKKLRGKRLAPVLIRELARRAQLEGIWQGVYAAELRLPTPFCTTRLLYRFLNPKKMKRCGHVIQTVPEDEVSINRLTKWFKVAKTVSTKGFRKMDSGDITAVSHMLNIYLQKFQVALQVDENFVTHYLLPNKDLVDSYVVEDVETNEITDFCSFLIRDVPVDNDVRYSSLRCAILFYYATYETSHLRLMKDVLVMAKEGGADVFLAYDIMGNYSFLGGLLFRAKKIGEGKMINYYLYNYGIRGELLGREIGLIL